MPTDWIDLAWLAALAAMLAAASWHDMIRARIPNQVVLAGIFTAFLLAALPGGIGVVSAGSGLLVGLALLLPFYLLGVMGAGDVKLFAATGAFIGFPAVIGVALLTFLAGGVLSLALALRLRSVHSVLVNLRTGLLLGLAHLCTGSLPRKGDLPVTESRIPYGVAIAVGTAASVVLSHEFSWMRIF